MKIFLRTVNGPRTGILETLTLSVNVVRSGLNIIKILGAFKAPSSVKLTELGA
jgi:hypothetical protein